MKKNIMMRLAAFLLVAVLLSTSIIGGTWAKYVSTANNGDGGETATVAKWGVNVTANALDNDEYQTVALSDEETAVSILTDAKLLAPGSGVKFGTFDVEGTPEVKVKVSYTATVVFNGWVLNDTTVYMPLVFIINGTPLPKYGDTIDPSLDKNDDGNISTLEEYKLVIEGAIKEYSKTYPADTDLSTKEDYTLNVSCYWDFESENDPKDTELGNAAATSSASTVNVKLTCTVSQVDE